MQGFYQSNRIRVSLGTKDPIVARARRDDLARGDEEYRAFLTHAVAMETAGEPLDADTAKRQYTVARARAMSAGVHYSTIDQLADQRDLRDLVRRALAIEDRSTSDGRLNPHDIDAMLGGVGEPREKVSDAFRMFAGAPGPLSSHAVIRVRLAAPTGRTAPPWAQRRTTSPQSGGYGRAQSSL